MAQQWKVGKVATTIRTEFNMEATLGNGVTTVVRYYNTDVVRFNDQKVRLDGGGYRTQTTKTRMNQTANQFGLGFQVYQKDFQWFVTFKGQTYPFTDGMVLIRR